nr:TetR/AcrR family transcriptional regulator [bacterium]
MRERNEQAFQRKKAEIMEACFNCYAKNGLTGTGIQALADACGLSKASLYTYFDALDDLIVESTAYCMSKVEDEFMQFAPKGMQDISRFIDEVPYLTAERHGKKYRLMYQVYTHPKYIEHGKAFFVGVNERYHAYAKQLEPLLGMPCDVITPLIFIFVRASVHYALFEDEYYLKSQMKVLKQSVFLLSRQYQKENQE